MEPVIFQLQLYPFFNSTHWIEIKDPAPLQAFFQLYLAVETFHTSSKQLKAF